MEFYETRCKSDEIHNKIESLQTNIFLCKYLFNKVFLMNLAVLGQEIFGIDVQVSISGNFLIY